MTRHFMLLAIGLVGLGLMAAQVASAHTGQASITCSSVTFSYTDFVNAPNTVSEQIQVDRSTVYSAGFSFNGSSGGHAVGISVPQDGEAHTIRASASWDTNGEQGSFEKLAELVCGEKPPSATVPPETTPLPPVETTPPPPPVETTPPTVEAKEPLAIVGTPPVSEDKPAPKAQKKAKGKVVAAKPDTAPQAAPFTL